MLIPFYSFLVAIAWTQSTLAQSEIERARARYLDSSTIRGVNLGGWLLTERWITPSVYRNSGASDEWHLCVNQGKDGCRRTLERHWQSFITRDDLYWIQQAGLNSVRIPVGYWAVDVRDSEPYTSGQYPYLINAVRWAREFGLSVSIDLHGLPGGQNGQDNSGITNVNEFAANSTNLDRAVAVIRNLSGEFSRAEYGGVVRAIELANEPRLTSTFTMDRLQQYYTAAATAVREASSNTILIAMHDAFYGPRYWANYDPLTPSSLSSSFPSPNYVLLDTHQYYAFPPLGNLSQPAILQGICNMSAILKGPGAPAQGIPRTVVGEWSLESGSGHDAAASASPSSQDKRTWLRTMFEAQVAAYSPNGPDQPGVGWYYWTWKTEYDHDTWSYRRGMWDGFIPQNIRNASNLVFPLKPNGCIDETFQYTAPRRPGAASGGGWTRGGANDGNLLGMGGIAVWGTWVVVSWLA